MKNSTIRGYIKEHLSEKRYRHVLGVTETTLRLCSYHNLDKKKGEIAALLHDVARETPSQRVIELAKRDSYVIEPWEMEHPVLLHGRAGAVLSREIFGIEDPEILDAVISHTTGRLGMGAIAKVLFVADYIEPGREHVTEEYRRELTDLNLDTQVLKVLSDLIIYIRGRGMFIAPPSLDLLKELQDKRIVKKEYGEE